MEKYEQARELIAKGEIQGALDILLEKKDIQNQEEIIELSGWFHRNQNEFKSGIKDIKEKNLVDNHISKALVDLCDNAISENIINPIKSFDQQIEDRLKNNFDKAKLKIESSIAYFLKCEKLKFSRTFIVRVSKDEDNVIDDDRLTRIFKFKHRNIIKLLDYQMDEKPNYFVLECIDGIQLSHILGKVPLFKQIALDIAIQLSEALYYMHIHGEFHKSLKPSQILIDHEFNPVISLFEIIENHNTHTNLENVKYLYASPEKLDELDLNLPEDAKSNQFTLGLIIFELFSEHPLFEPSNEYVDIDKIQSKRKDFYNSRNTEPVIAEKVKDKKISKILSKMLSSNPDDRYPSLLEVSDELKKISINLKKKTFVDLVLASYSRCCINNIGLVNDFYTALFDNEHLGVVIKKRFDNYHNLNEDVEVAKTLEKVRRRKLRMTILLMTGAYENNSIFVKIIQLEGHHGINQIKYYEVFMDCLLEIVKKNDFLWKNYDTQNGNTLEEAWVSIKNTLLENIKKTIDLQHQKRDK